MGNPLKQRGLTPVKGLLAMALVFAVLALAPVCPAYACSCIPPAPPLDSLAEAAAVFQGEVVEVGALEAEGGVVNTADMVQVTFKVNQVWKGDIAETTTLTTAGSSASCGVEFQSGQTYVVYAHMLEGQLNASLCSRTAPVDLAAEDLEALGEGTVPGPSVSQPEPYPLPGFETPTPTPAPSGGAEEPGISRTEWLGIGGAAAAVVGLGLLVVVWLARPKK
jgi:hypothetical protein